MTMTFSWKLHQLVVVEPRTWAGINRPGGVAKITKLHYYPNDGELVERLDVKYILGGVDTKLDLDFVRPHEPLERQGRSRSSRDLFQGSPAKRTRDVVALASSPQQSPSKPTLPSKPVSASKQDKAIKSRKPKRRKMLPKVILQDKKKDNSQNQNNDPPALLDAPCGDIIVSQRCCVSPLQDTPSPLKRDSSRISITQEEQPMVQSKTTKKTIKESHNSSHMHQLLSTLGEEGAGPDTSKFMPVRNNHAALQDLTQTMADESNQKTKIRSKTTKTKSKLSTMTQRPDRPVLVTTMERPSETSRTKKTSVTLKGPAATKDMAESNVDGLSSMSLKRVPLIDVYHNACDQADGFVRSIVGKPVQIGKRKPTDMEATSAIVTKTVTTPTMDPSRQCDFTAILSQVLSRNDGEMGVPQVLTEVNKRSSKTPFTSEELQSCLKCLNEENKIFISDNVIYSMIH